MILVSSILKTNANFKEHKQLGYELIMSQMSFTKGLRLDNNFAGQPWHSYVLW